MSGKRSYTTYAGAPSANYKAARMIGGKVLRYNPTRPVVGSSRSRSSFAAAVRRVGEKKGVDTALTLSPIIATTNTNASSFTLNLVQAGNGSWQRVGKKINLESVRLRGIISFFFTPTVTTLNQNANAMRMVVVWDKQPSGTLPTFDTIFGNTVQDGTESTTYLDAVKYDNMDRFSVLRDTVISKAPEISIVTGTSNISEVECPFDEYIKLGGRETVYSGQSSPMTISDISSGALYVFFRAESNTAGLFCQVDSASFARLRYSDV